MNLKNYNITVSKGDLNEILADEEGIEDKSLLDKLDAAYEAGAESDVFDEMKYDEISEVLGTSVGALKASYHIAVEKITTLLKKND